jgi:uncharacterized membrane protein
MESRKVKASHGWSWINHGLQLLWQRLDVCIYFFVITMLLWQGVAPIPYAGYLLTIFLAPLVIGALGIACRNLESDGSTSVKELFSALSPFVPQLIRIGFINVACLIIAAAVIVIVAHDPALAMATLGDWQFYSQVMGKEISSAMFAGLTFAFAVSCILFFASWYSPMLVVFNKLKAADAMKKSLSVSLRNLNPFILYGAVLAGSWVAFGIAMYLLPSIILIPIGKSEWMSSATWFLSALYWPFVAPVIYASVYASYADVFPQQEV